jgi:predicted aspartyl protease
VVILVDTGSNHSFVDPYVVNNIQLPAHEESGLTVVAAKGLPFLA